MSDSEVSMKGGGYYSKNTQGAKFVIDQAGVHVLENLQRTILPGSERCFSVVDYGAADGGTSLDLITNIVSLIRERSQEQEISITYTDLPHNDFSALLRMIHTDTEDAGQTYASKHSNVYVLCSGTSFYQQIVPSETVDIGFSATAMHWLSSVPCSITDHIHAVGAVGDEWQVFCDYALRDWENILMMRARELVAGGVLVLANFCIDEEGHYLGNTGDVNMFDTFNYLWREMADSGMITEEEYQATVFPQFYKTIDQFREPFDDPNSKIRKAGLILDSIYTGTLKCPYRAEFNRIGDAVAFADAYVPTLRSWSETVFKHALNQSRPSDERQRIVDYFYDSYNQLVRQEPERHSMDYVHTYMVVTKN